jgi:hypothetical protein
VWQHHRTALSGDQCTAGELMVNRASGRRMLGLAAEVNWFFPHLFGINGSHFSPRAPKREAQFAPREVALMGLE